MTPLAQTALDFARECLGWEDAAGTHGINTVFEHLGEGPCAALTFTDLNAVMDAVRGWCDARNAVIEISCAKDNVLARVRVLTIAGEPYWQHCDTLQEALLAACIEASRKLRAA
jgi:hypothetical protein